MTSHNAPPVVYPLGHSRFHGYLLAVLWLAGSVLSMFWLYESPAMNWQMGLVLTLSVSGGVAAYRGWKNAPVGHLVWDGQCWRWEGTGYLAGVAEQKLTVVVDFQNLLLLRLENPAQVCMWLWAERQVLPERWLDLRRAVYSPHKSVKRAQQEDLQALEPMQAVAVSSHDVPVDIVPKP